MRYFRDWQFFNRKPNGSELLLQACYSGYLWDMGFGLDPARIWIGRFMKTEHKYCFHLHIYLPFAKHFGRRITYFGRISIGWRWKGKWHNIPKGGE